MPSEPSGRRPSGCVMSPTSAWAPGGSATRRTAGRCRRPRSGWSARSLGRDVDMGAGGRDRHGRGPALDFCLLVTQRRHRDDVAIGVEGRAADEWLDIAQAFAGPPGDGRQPGQFPRGMRILVVAGSEIVIRWKTSAASSREGRRDRPTGCGCGRGTRRADRVGGVHGGLELDLVGLERGELVVDVVVTSSTWSGSSASHSSSGVGRWWARPCSRKKCGSRAATMPSHARKPAWRWSGCSRYCFHGS